MRISNSVIITILILLFLIFRGRRIKDNFLPKGYHKMPDGRIMKDSDHDIKGGKVNKKGCTQPKFTGNLACYDGNLFLPVDENRLICFGDNNCEVAKMQKRLNSIETTNIVSVDGSFGCYTLEKLRRNANIIGSCVRVSQLPVIK